MTNKVFFELGPISIKWYAIIILTGVIVAYLLANKEAKRQKLPKDFVTNILFYTIPIGIIGARAYYVIFNYRLYQHDFLSIFKILEGGLAIYGAVIAGIVFIYFYTKKHRVGFLTTLDLLAPSLIIAQSIGRWGNFINEEAYGPITTLKYLQHCHVPNFIINGMYINGNYHLPTFFYESLWCFLGFVILILIRYLWKKKRIGTLTGIYFIWYGLGRFYIEGLRTDSLYFFSFRVSQIVSLTLVLIGIILLYYIYHSDKTKIRKKERKDMVK